MSLLTGWLPLTVELLAIVLIAVAIARRTRRWWLIWIPVCVGVGVLSVLIAVRTEHAEGLASDPPPAQLWWWVGLSGFAVAVLVVGMRRTQMWRRGVAVLAVIAALAATGVPLNQWVGYFTTVQEAWSQLTAGPLPDQVAVSDLGRLRGSGQQMTEGKVVAISTPKDISGFTHRTEYVYLPPLWFDGTAPPKLPVLMMIGGEFNTPADWIRTGNAISTVDAYARTHAGAAPILVFPDVGGSFNNDTECVDGPRGNVTTHLVDEVRPYVVSHFDADSSAANWGVVGWSMGGTCAVDLTVMHPEDFATFEDIAGDIGPNAGTPQQTVDRLFGGNHAAYDAFNPVKVMAGHGRYLGVAGWFDESNSTARHGHARPHGGQRHPPGGWGNGNGLGGRGDGGDTGQELPAARTLCADAERVGIECSIALQSGGHTWQFAESAFGDALGWLMERISPAAPPAPGIIAQTTGRATPMVR